VGSVCPKKSRALSRALVVGFAVALLASTAGPASAQGLLGAIFGALTGRPEASSPRNAYADPNNDGRYNSSRSNSSRQVRRESSQEPTAAGGRGPSFCVRLCDGRYFPMQRHANATPAQLCSSMCPAARTKIFSGSEIARATAPDGSRYEDLDNAFTYRERIVDKCTCNGRDAFGLAPIDVNSDPTLRTGDIVATQNGLMAYSAAAGSRRGAETAANFTPIDSSRASRDVREKLADTAVAKPN
jgi:hypothetical protein